MGLDRHRLDFSAVKQNGFLDNGESEPGAAKFPAAALVDAVETVEKPRETLFRNSGPVIGKGETPSMRFLPCRNFDGSPFGSRLEFDRSGNWKEVNCRGGAVPESVIPSRIQAYIKDNYSSDNVRTIERHIRGYEVKLSSGFELVFDKNCNFKRMDD